jgi:hypothetical protein
MAEADAKGKEETPSLKRPLVKWKLGGTFIPKVAVKVEPEEPEDPPVVVLPTVPDDTPPEIPAKPNLPLKRSVREVERVAALRDKFTLRDVLAQHQVALMGNCPYRTVINMERKLLVRLWYNTWPEDLQSFCHSFLLREEKFIRLLPAGKGDYGKGRRAIVGWLVNTGRTDVLSGNNYAIPINRIKKNPTIKVVIVVDGDNLWQVVPVIGKFNTKHIHAIVYANTEVLTSNPVLYARGRPWLNIIHNFNTQNDATDLHVTMAVTACNMLLDDHLVLLVVSGDHFARSTVEYQREIREFLYPKQRSVHWVQSVKQMEAILQDLAPLPSRK